MKWRGWTLALLLVCSLTPFAIAQSGAPDRYVPRLGDVMSAVELRHMKLSLAASAQNWERATYELGKIKAGLIEAASLYPGVPVTSATTMATPVQSIADAIDAKDSRRFAKSFGELTDACNACHQSIGRGFIVVRAPTASPFSYRLFSNPVEQKPH